MDGYTLKELLVSIFLLAIGFSAGGIFYRHKMGDITEFGYEQFRIIMYQSIDKVMRYNKIKTPGDTVTAAVAEIYNKIICCEVLPYSDRAFWTEARIKKVARPIVLYLVKEKYREQSMQERHNA